MTALDVFRSLPAVVDIGSIGEQAKSLFGEAQGRIEFVFRRPLRRTREVLHAALSNVAHEVRGDIDWVTE